MDTPSDSRRSLPSKDSAIGFAAARRSSPSIANEATSDHQRLMDRLQIYELVELKVSGDGPLGQGIANAVGLALAEKHLAARYNKPDAEIVDHYTYCIIGDGCQMEGISNEACSLAGHWGLEKLIAFYDDNHISIDGDTEIAFTENVDKRFEALGWHIIWVKNGNTGYDEIRDAIKEAKTVTDKPTLIKVTTTIGFGSPNKANSYSVHGAALGAKEVDATRQNLGWPFEPFHVPDEVKKHWSRHTPDGAALEAEWNAKFSAYESKYPEDAAELKSIVTGVFPAGWEKALPELAGLPTMELIHKDGTHPTNTFIC
ncbi:hypothetical protein SSX86_024718 [Deinandra increscens subsp. villosa]|uniref:Transketolase N-terminal domain-containing protein n=1 Tax=Deinandra increscens subsp. villosa TaxID=3103831 RepID=A0AAP0CB63_9ASTR